MSFDEQLKRAIDSLTAHLHDEISRRTQQIRDELTASVEAERESAAAEAIKRQQRLDTAVADAAHTRQQLDDALADAQQQRKRTEDLAAENARHQQRVDELTAETARQQQQLDQLSAEAARQHQRFDDLTAENAQQQHEVDEAAAEAARLRQELEAAVSKAAAAPPLVAPPVAAVAPGLSSTTPERLVNAIRQIDDAHTLSDILDRLLKAAAVETERVAVLLVHGNRYTGWQSIGFDPPVARGAVVDLPGDASVIPIDIGGETVAVLRAEHAGTNPGRNWPDPNLELLTRHAARCLESVTAFKAARAALVVPIGTEDSADDASGDEEASARRYAKLLVSEIRLYHEPEVVAGRRERDLTTRLGGEIARARVLYEQRVPTHIRQQTDYFHDELVRRLANGDSTLLDLS